MPPLNTGLRNDLENVVKKARVIAERGAKSAIESLTVHEAKAGNHLDEEGRKLRNRLRAHGRQLGDSRNAKREQETVRLVRECAYEHWHRMLFARFLAENELLIHPEHNVSVSLDDVEELAREEGVEQWELASRYAERMLPQIFRPDDPVLAVAFPRERTLELERLLESLPTETLRADDSLGWVYQFWQAEEKDRVNASGEKITGETLPAVTQLFTEHYMVLFLLHNTIGAWHAGKVLAKKPELASRATTEQELRDAVRLDPQGGYGFEYLRFIREQREGDEEGEPTGPWRPAAGAFDGWPRAANSLKVLDPCCGSGHFLVAAFELLVRLRMAEESLSLKNAIGAVLADNLFGLELDARCTQIAAFALALAAWRLVGNPIDLPILNIACSGLAVGSTKNEWTTLAGNDERLRAGMERLYDLFVQAPELGSLIGPKALKGDLLVADFTELHPLLEKALEQKSDDVEGAERAVAAQGMARAAELLSGQFALVTTNFPFLGLEKQTPRLASALTTEFEIAKRDLATAFLLRSKEWVRSAGTCAVVMPSEWTYLRAHRHFRRWLLDHASVEGVCFLGQNAFVSGLRANPVLTILGWGTTSQPTFCLDAREMALPDKDTEIRCGPGSLASANEWRANPDCRMTIGSVGSSDAASRLSEFADARLGISAGDGTRFERSFWELPGGDSNWEFLQGTSTGSVQFSGRSTVVLWEKERGQIRELANSVRHLNHSAQNWQRGRPFWGKDGIALSQMGKLPVTTYTGEIFDSRCLVLVPKDLALLPAILSFCLSGEMEKAVRIYHKNLKITSPKTILDAAFSLEEWQQVAKQDYPNGIPQPHSNDSTQWLFHGHPAKAEPASLHQVAVARLLGYRWPAEFDAEMRLAEEARECVARCDELKEFADEDGIVCIPPVRGERPAADRLLALLSACGVKPDRDLDLWLRESFFEEHCALFHHRPFVWHIWDGRKDGFHALVNYHKLAAPGGSGRRLLTTLTHSYLGDWIKEQKHQVDDGKPGAEALLTAALELKAELEKMLAGEPPYDIFVRWKPLHEQPIGWEPDINDGVRLNIRPFLMAKDVARKGAGVLRWKPTRIKWGKDRGKEPQSLRPKADFPWFWSCDPEKQDAHRKDFAGGDKFDGNRWNDLHYTSAFKQAARERKR